MSTRFRMSLVLLLLGAPGCGCSGDHVSEPGDPQAAEVVLAHWAALQKGDWEAAYARLHPDLKANKRSLKRFSDLHARRLKAKGLPHDIKVTESTRAGDDVLVSFDVYAAPPGGGEPVAVPPRRRATLRKVGGSWALMTHDLLAVGL
jgi:hypothetical protein